MAKTSDEVIQQIIDLYEELGVYAHVAKKLGISASTVSKYIKLHKEQEQCENSEKTEFKGTIKDIKDIPRPQSKEEWQKILELTKEESEACDELRKEGVM